jgi:hypothetical protein
MLADPHAKAAPLQLGDAALEPARDTRRARRRRRHDADEITALEPARRNHLEA